MIAKPLEEELILGVAARYRVTKFAAEKNVA
jgi:hypothetical protein